MEAPPVLVQHPAPVLLGISFYYFVQNESQKNALPSKIEGQSVKQFTFNFHSLNNKLKSLFKQTILGNIEQNTFF